VPVFSRREAGRRPGAAMAEALAPARFLDAGIAVADVDQIPFHVIAR
jgi:pheromone shutdown protein TraB